MWYAIGDDIIGQSAINIQDLIRRELQRRKKGIIEQFVTPVIIHRNTGIDQGIQVPIKGPDIDLAFPGNILRSQAMLIS